MKTPVLNLSPHEFDVLSRWSRSRAIASRIVTRSRIILRLAAGQSIARVADALDLSPGTTRLWRDRFIRGGLSVLGHEAAGRGRKPALSPAIRHALGQNPVAPHRSVRALARELGVSPATISRWRRRGADK